jgi:hypothetical protein
MQEQQKKEWGFWNMLKTFWQPDRLRRFYFCMAMTFSHFPNRLEGLSSQVAFQLWAV